MYGWLWNHLPGPTWVRALTCSVAFVGVIGILFLWVFPWLEPRLPFTDVTVESQAALPSVVHRVVHSWG
jgi:hypothetical protein